MMRIRQMQRFAATYHSGIQRITHPHLAAALPRASSAIISGRSPLTQEMKPSESFTVRHASAGAAVAGAAITADAAMPLGPAVVNSTGTYPDYSVTVPTIAGEAKTDWLLSWFQSPVYFLHDTAGLSWVASVALASFALRAFTARMHFGSLRGAARMQMYSPEMQEYQKRLTAAKNSGDQEAMQRLAAEFRAFLKEKQIPNPLTFFKNIIIQMPLFIGSFFAVKRFARDAHLIPGITENVPSFLPALHMPDPTLILPITSLALSWLAIWTNPNVVGIPSAGLTPAGQRLLFSTLGGLFFFVGIKMPAIVQVYLVTTTASMLGQQLMLRSKGIRNWLGFPSEWPLSPERAAEIGKQQKQTFFAPFTPVFRRFSALAEFDIKRAISGEDKTPQQVYVTKFGLRDPGVPLPPDGLHVNTATAAAPTTTQSFATTTQSSATPKQAVPTLLSNKPSKQRR